MLLGEVYRELNSIRTKKVGNFHSHVPADLVEVLNKIPPDEANDAEASLISLHTGFLEKPADPLLRIFTAWDSADLSILAYSFNGGTTPIEATLDSIAVSPLGQSMLRVMWDEGREVYAFELGVLLSGTRAEDYNEELRSRFDMLPGVDYVVKPYFGENKNCADSEEFLEEAISSNPPFAVYDGVTLLTKARSGQWTTGASLYSARAGNGIIVEGNWYSMVNSSDRQQVQNAIFQQRRYLPPWGQEIAILREVRGENTCEPEVTTATYMESLRQAQEKGFPGRQ